jgi:hypothetical protein
MRNRNSIGLVFVLVVVLVLLIGGLLILYVVNPVFENQIKTAPDGMSSYFETADYKLDPTTILQDLNKGEKHVFVTLRATPEVEEKLYSEPFPWKQSDYLKIANALHKYVWNETPEDWQVYNLSFYGDCKYAAAGFDLFQITFFKDIGSSQYTAREIDIFPLYGGAATGGGTNFPRPLFGWKNLNLDKIKVTATDALRIAEENGGSNVRLAFDNKCHIFVSITSHTQKWRVSYREDPNARSVFEINIDPFTGEFKFPK